MFFFPNHVNNQANLKSPFKNHQQFGSVRCVSDLFFPKHLRNKQVAKIEVNKNCHFWRVFSPTETSQTNLPTVPSSSKEGAVGSKFTDYRRIRSCGMGWLLLLFLRSWWSSFCWDAQEVVMGAPIPCMVYIYITYMNGWFLMVKYGKCRYTIHGCYWDWMVVLVGWFCEGSTWLLTPQLANSWFLRVLLTQRKRETLLFFLGLIVMCVFFLNTWLWW